MNEALDSPIGEAGIVKDLVSSHFLLKEIKNKTKKRYNTHLLKAVQSADNFLVERCIGWGASPNATCQFGRLTACHIACFLGNAEVLQILLKRGADPKRRDEKGRQPIHLAALNGHSACLQVLYAAIPQLIGVKVTANSGNGTQDEDWDSFSHIHAHVHDMITDRIRLGATPVQIAFKQKHEECVLFLLSVGASLSTDEMQYNNDLVQHEDEDALTFQKAPPSLLAQEDNDLPDGDVRPLRKSMSFDLSERWSESQKEIIIIPVEVRPREGPGLLQCAEEKLLEPLRQLLFTLDFIDERDDENRTPFHVAVSNGWREGVQLLIEFGSDITCRTKNLDTPLHLAAQKGYSDILQLLVAVKDSKKIIYFPNREKNTPLLLAVLNNHLDCVKILCENGANLDYMVSRDSVLHIAARHDYAEILQYFLERGDLAPLLMSPTEVPPDQGYSPLHIAAKRGHDRSIKALLTHSTEILEVQDSDCSTPLILAALEGHDTSVKILLEYGASLTAVTWDVSGNRIRALDMVRPAVLNEVLDSCICDNGEEVSLDFQVLTTGESPFSIVNAMKNGYTHGLVESYVFLMWRQLKNFWILALISHFLLAGVMTYCFTHGPITFFPVTMIVSCLISISIADEILNVHHSFGRGETWILSAGYIGMFLLNWHHEYNCVCLSAYLTAQLAWLNILLLTPSLSYGHYGTVFVENSIKAIKGLVIWIMTWIAAKAHLQHGNVKLNSVVSALIIILVILSLKGPRDKASDINKKQKKMFRLAEKHNVNSMFQPIRNYKFLKTDRRALPNYIHDLLI